MTDKIEIKKTTCKSLKLREKVNIITSYIPSERRFITELYTRNKDDKRDLIIHVEKEQLDWIVK